MDDPWEGPPKYLLRCYHCGRTHPECNFYPILGIMAPPTHGREMQLCNDCDRHIREYAKLKEMLEDCLQPGVHPYRTEDGALHTRCSHGLFLTERCERCDAIVRNRRKVNDSSY